ncbi:hypothetical protein GCM10009668_23300 [Nocardioides dubius]|uniref:Uncharacterized protein n=1 Tax=Nocardioides dubius TaxID=317019 RepID=A0ABN1TUP7_9ACTN
MTPQSSPEPVVIGVSAAWAGAAVKVNAPNVLRVRTDANDAATGARLWRRDPGISGAFHLELGKANLRHFPL